MSINAIGALQVNGAFDRLKRTLSGRRQAEPARSLYLELVEAARNPALYRRFAIPDTLDGRFDSVVLHLAIYLAAVKDKAQEKEAAAFARALASIFFADMDRSLRELGIGDLSVGKQVRKMASAFYGRVEAYHKALAANSDLEAALARNLYRGKPPRGPAAGGLAKYARSAYIRLRKRPAKTLLEGALAPSPFTL